MFTTKVFQESLLQDSHLLLAILAVFVKCGRGGLNGDVVVDLLLLFVNLLVAS